MIADFFINLVKTFSEKLSEFHYGSRSGHTLLFLNFTCVFF